MILGIQLLGILFCLFMIYYSFLHFKRKEFKPVEFSFWVVLWITSIIVTAFPTILDPIVKTLNLVRRMDFFIILGFMFLIGLTFYTYTVVKKNQKRIERIVREVAVKKSR